ncbi:unnamed protein product [Sympodiomycopsis kandeliae]
MTSLPGSDAQRPGVQASRRPGVWGRLTGSEVPAGGVLHFTSDQHLIVVSDSAMIVCEDATSSSSALITGLKSPLQTIWISPLTSSHGFKVLSIIKADKSTANQRTIKRTRSPISSSSSLRS